MVRPLVAGVSAVLLSSCAQVALAPPPPPTCRELGKVEGRAVNVTPDRLVTFTANMDVNTDGTFESYGVNDLGSFASGRLNTTRALNTICNGVRIRQRGAGGQDTLVFDHTRCGPLIAEFKRIRSANWTPADGRYVEFYAIARQPGPSQPGVSRGVPCVKGDYYVSQTARPMNAAVSVCDPQHWIDAARIPAIVVPIALVQAQGVGLFDVAVVRRVGGDRWFPAIVGDTNNRLLGEGSLRLAQQVTGETTRPANYRALLAVQPTGLYEYVIFPGSRSGLTTRNNAMEPAIASAADALATRYTLATRPRLCP